METEALRWFQQVADGATVTEVAELHLVSQPGVSRALARLEEEVGAPLLRKVGRQLRPTHAGTVFKRHVDALLHRLDDGLAAVNELVDPETGTIALAFQLSLGTWLVPEMIGGFQKTHPRVRFRLIHSQGDESSSVLVDGDADLEITARRRLGPEEHWEPIIREPLLLAVPPQHRLARRTEVTLSEVADEPFIMLSPSWQLRQTCDELCVAAGFTPQVRYEGEDLPMVRGFVTAGLGVAILPAMGAGPRQGRRGEHLLAITDAGAYRMVGIAWSRDRRLLPSAELFRDHVLAAAGRAASR